MLVATVESDRMPLKLNGERMRELRTALELTQTEIAGRAGMPVGRWNDLETGRRTNLTVETLGNIARALECPPADLLIDDAPPRRKKK